MPYFSAQEIAQLPRFTNIYDGIIRSVVYVDAETILRCSKQKDFCGTFLYVIDAHNQPIFSYSESNSGKIFHSWLVDNRPILVAGRYSRPVY